MPGQVWYLNVSIPDLCLPLYFDHYLFQHPEDMCFCVRPKLRHGIPFDRFSQVVKLEIFINVVCVLYVICSRVCVIIHIQIELFS